MDAAFLEGGDYRVPLTPAQREHYSLIFELNDHSDRNRLLVSELANFMDSLGHGVPVAELEVMMHDLGIVEDTDGSIALETFLEFMRRTLVADLPAEKMERIHEVFARTTGACDAGESGHKDGADADALPTTPLPPPLLSGEETFSTELPTPRTVGRDHAGTAGAAGAAGGGAAGAARAAPTATKAQVARMLKSLGFLLDGVLSELFDELDADADGRLSEAEFVTCVGMIKANLLEVMHLEQSFVRFRKAAESATGTTPPPSPTRRASTPPSPKRGSPPSPKRGAKAGARAAVGSSTPDNLHVVRASDLVAALNVTMAEAEEMIFIADIKDNQLVDFTEFRQVVVNWSG